MSVRAKYHFASMTFIAGIILSIVGIGYGIFVHLSRTSDPCEIRLTYGLVGVGLLVTLSGLNAMMKSRVSYSRYITLIGAVVSVVGVISFLISYPENWMYPFATYVIATYSCGICILIGNAFAKVVLNLIEEKTVVKEEIAEEEIEKVIDETMKRVVDFSDTSIKFKDVSTEDFKPGKAFFEKDKIVKVKDDVSEVYELRKIKESKVEIKDEEIDDIANMLRETIKKEKDKKFWR